MDILDKAKKWWNEALEEVENFTIWGAVIGLILLIVTHYVLHLLLQPKTDWFSTLVDTIVNETIPALIAFVIGIFLFRHIRNRTAGFERTKLIQDIQVSVADEFKQIALSALSLSHIKIYEEDGTAYLDLAKYIKDNGVKEAWLIHYSGTNASRPLLDLFREGATITLWVHIAGNAISIEQQERIEKSVKWMRGQLSRSPESKSANAKLTVNEYDSPGSIRGILLDNKLLMIGWYTYERGFPPDLDYPNDEIQLSGHDRPCIIIDYGHPNFATLMRMFRDQIRDFEETQKKANRSPRLLLTPDNNISGISVRN